MKRVVAVALLVAGLSVPALACSAEVVVALTGQASSVDSSAGQVSAVRVAAQSVTPGPAGQAGVDEVPQMIRDMARWIVASDDHQQMPFIVVDKARAEVFLFDQAGQFLQVSPALLGLANGDALSPGMGTRKLSSIRPAERTTPAGRFPASLDLNLHGDRVLWIDDDSGVALHPVITTNPSERRRERLASKTPDDNRITYGCINVDEAFFEKIVVPQFRASGGIVYILPESAAIDQVFGSMAAEFLSVRGSKPSQ